MNCPACESPAPEGSRFCPSCGRPLAGPDAAVEATARGAGAGALDVTTADPRAFTLPPLPTGTALAAVDSLPPGTVLSNRYRIVRLLGRGGMGVVYLADDLRLGHPVALKFLPAMLARDDRQLRAFHNEVSVARQISHPNVCRVYDIGDVDGHLFLSMEYVDGEDLASVLRRRGALPEIEAVELTRQICAGLAAVHARGVLHRDLKPANILVSRDGHAHLSDFGIASAGGVDEPERATEGTPAYMAPEQLVDRKASVASDIYALGLVMFEIFSGRRALDAQTVAELTRQQDTFGPRVSADLSAVAPRLRDTIEACLSRDPTQRPGSVEAVMGMLQTVLLDAHATARRIVQVIAQALIPAVLVAGIALTASGGTRTVVGLPLILAAVAVAWFELRNPLGWEVTYKGHRIRFQNHPVFGERLYLDGVLADRGRFGLRVTLRGTIESGAGAGERITAEVHAGLTRFSCRIVAESFSPTRASQPQTAEVRRG